MKEKNSQLLEEEKEYNKLFSKRIWIESILTTCKIKKYRIMSDIFRN
jgi:hypothetical protein